MTFEKVILDNLIFNEEYIRKALPFLKEEYFSEKAHKITYELIDSYVGKYNTLPSKKALEIDLGNKEGVSQEDFRHSLEIINSLEKDTNDLNWLIEQTEKHCQEKAVHNALLESIIISQGKDPKKSKGAIPQILSEALAVSFDTNIGHDYFEDAEDRFDYYHKIVDRIKFDIHYLNVITNGGLPKKTLSVFVAGINVGKTQLMCHMAGNNLRDGKNVLYITLEMSQEEISKRIDANLLDIAMDDLLVVPKVDFLKKMEKVKKGNVGKLIVKEYPTSQAGAANFRYLLNELRLKKKFVPDIVYVDYINICASSRIKRGQSNSYEYIKAIAEEFRGLAVEMNLPIVTATQLTRGAYKSSSIDLDDIAESFGLPATADFVAGLVTSEEFEEMNQIMVEQMKNRLGNKSTNKRFIIGVDRDKMRFYDVEQSAQEDLLDGPVMDRTKFGEEDRERNKFKKKFDKSMFGDFE